MQKIRIYFMKELRKSGFPVITIIFFDIVLYKKV